MSLPLFVSPLQCVLPCVLAVGLAAGALHARPRQLSDLSNRSAIEDARFDFNTKTFDMNSGLQGKRVEFNQWHTNFSNIGSKRSDVSVDASSSLGGKTFPYTKIEHKNAGIAMESTTRKMAQFRNADQVRDMVIASQFEKTSMISVEGKALQEMVDEMSLKDINRFQAFHNKTDEGIPQVQAGSSEAPVVSPKHTND